MRKNVIGTAVETSSKITVWRHRNEKVQLRPKKWLSYKVLGMQNKLK